MKNVFVLSVNSNLTQFFMLRIVWKKRSKIEIKKMGIQTLVQVNTRMTQPRIRAHAKCEPHTEVRGGGGGV